MGLKTEELYNIAKKNILRENITFEYMKDYIFERFNPVDPREKNISLLEQEELYINDGGPLVFTNKEIFYGATPIIYPEVQKKISELVKGNYYTIPSSIHECLIVPAFDYVVGASIKEITEKDVEVYNEMIKDVNSTNCLPLEILDNEVYFYSAKENILQLGRDALNDLNLEMEEEPEL